MLGCDDNGSHAGFFGQCNDFVGIEFFRIELQGCISIPITENARKRLDLFAIAKFDWLSLIYTAIYGIKSEMDKH